MFGGILGVFLLGSGSVFSTSGALLSAAGVPKYVPDFKIQSGPQKYNSRLSEHWSAAEIDVAEIAFWSEPCCDAHCTVGVTTYVRFGRRK